MVLLAIFVISAYLAFEGMRIGFFPVLGRCLMGVIAIATAVGFVGPLREQIPSENEYLLGGCLAAIGVATYLFQRGLAGFCLPEREMLLPELFDRIGGALAGFVGSLIGLGFICMVIVTFPLPEAVSGMKPQFRQGAQLAMGAARMVGVFAGNGQPISLRAFTGETPFEYVEPGEGDDLTEPHDESIDGAEPTVRRQPPDSDG